MYRLLAGFPCVDFLNKREGLCNLADLQPRKLGRREKARPAKLQGRAALHDNNFAQPRDVHAFVVAAVVYLKALREDGELNLLFFCVVCQPHLVLSTHKTALPPRKFRSG